MDDRLGLRERKKAATRQALHEAALRLAIEQGLDRVTVEAIADAAEVSRRTFSNYFASKEEALLHADLVRLRSVIDLVRSRPQSEEPWTALRHAAERLAAEAAREPEWFTRRRLVGNHPGLAAQQISMYGAVERDLATELLHRMPGRPDATLRSRVLAATFLNALRTAIQHWMDHPDRPLGEVVGAALSYIRPA
ncbi:TetR/AcrR family transcriptional regulator [Plantactinospora sp. KBS50]|uniref:TetR/AcrR family transcriptional regulator n=1 Tax=Plantactinospora sp. KBS50 TaxID=2024580 RepID=UPI000BAB1A84|nr:TetR/AcrR family transcriptional regulator [Plantactinospora sp. KBS50]ASW53114.1 TetR family transcriptional regulator [Plantactinospora sp. KBS50]